VALLRNLSIVKRLLRQLEIGAAVLAIGIKKK
jgi:hypothetical protein